MNPRLLLAPTLLVPTGVVAAGRFRRRRRTVAASVSHRRDRRASTGTCRLSVVLPAYGEEQIGAAVERVRRELHDVAADGGLEVIVVDDGSNERHAALADASGADRVIHHEVNRGKGAAVRTGALVATGRVIAFTDSDLSYAPGQIRSLLLEAEQGWDVVVGSRDHSDSATLVETSTLRALGHRAVNLATRSVLVVPRSDTQCGIKAFRAEAARALFSRARIERFAFDIELFFLAERIGLAVREMPVVVANSERSTVHVVRDTVRLAKDLARIRWWARRRRYDVPAPVALPPAAREPLELDLRDEAPILAPAS